MSTCPNKELYCAFIDDEVSPILKKELESHLLECEKCRFLVNRYKYIKIALRDDETPNLDLNYSFEKLITKRNSFKKRRYLVFPINRRYKIFVSAVASMFLFAFLFVLLRYNSVNYENFTFHKKDVKFTPIVPISHRQHNGNIINNIDLRDMTSVVKTKKYNKKIYKNFANTFNNFNYLYTSLEINTNDFAVTMPNMNEEIPYNYGMSMPIYTNLKKDVK